MTSGDAKGLAHYFGMFLVGFGCLDLQGNRRDADESILPVVVENLGLSRNDSDGFSMGCRVDRVRACARRRRPCSETARRNRVAGQFGLSRNNAGCHGVVRDLKFQRLTTPAIRAHRRRVTTCADELMMVVIQHHRHRAEVNGAAESA